MYVLTYVYECFTGKESSYNCRYILSTPIGDNAMTSSIRIAQVFSDLVGNKTRALWKVYGEMLKYIINYALYLAHYRHIFI